MIKKVKVGDILLRENELEVYEKKYAKTYTISDKLWEGHKRRRIEHAKKGNGFGYSLFNENSPYTSTISARYYKDGSEILIKSNQIIDRPRKLHPIEAARLQGYPVKNPCNSFQNKEPKIQNILNNEWFEIPVSDIQAYKQFGNSVSVPVINEIAKAIKDQLLKY